MSMDRIGSRPVGTNHDTVCPSTTNGMDYLRNPRLFKGMGFSLEERQALGIHGMLPPRVKSQAEQTDNCLRNCKYNIFVKPNTVRSKCSVEIAEIYSLYFFYKNYVKSTYINYF